MELPQPWELISFFESEPTLLDQGAGWGWAYNRLTFSVEREGDTLKVELEPNDYQLRLEWTRADGTTRLRLSLDGVKRLAVDEHGGREVLVASFADDPLLHDLRLRLSPHINVLWGVEAL
jgi:hypothetical protein